MLSCFASPKGASCKRTKSPGLVLSIQPNWYQSVGRMFLWTGLKRWISGDEIDHLTSYAMETEIRPNLGPLQLAIKIWNGK